jgi:hypothetical protein
MKEIRILGINVTQRTKEAHKIQETLTKYGCSIRTRIGLHDVKDNYCSPSGLILLELYGDIEECNKLENELHNIEGLDVQKIVFDL